MPTENIIIPNKLLTIISERNAPAFRIFITLHMALVIGEHTIVRNNINKNGVKYFFIANENSTNIKSINKHSKIFLYNLFNILNTSNYLSLINIYSSGYQNISGLHFKFTLHNICYVI